MRLTIVAGLILGASLAVQSMLGTHAKAKIGTAARAARVHEHEVAPWYITMNDVTPSSTHLADMRLGVGRT
jgi:hypothetical protein